MHENLTTGQIDTLHLRYLEAIERVAHLSEDGIKPNRRMIYYLACTLFQQYGLVFQEEEEVIGFIVGFPIPDSKGIWIHQIAIHPLYRGKGYGTRLMKELFQFAHDRQIENIKLSVKPGNPALEWYGKLGFQVESSSPEIEMYVMKKQLY